MVYELYSFLKLVGTKIKKRKLTTKMNSEAYTFLGPQLPRTELFYQYMQSSWHNYGSPRIRLPES